MQPVLDRIMCGTMTVDVEANTSEAKFFTTSQGPSHCILTNGNTLEYILHFK